MRAKPVMAVHAAPVAAAVAGETNLDEESEEEESSEEETESESEEEVAPQVRLVDHLVVEQVITAEGKSISGIFVSVHSSTYASISTTSTSSGRSSTRK